jgi:hypothetical protein
MASEGSVQKFNSPSRRSLGVFVVYLAVIPGWLALVATLSGQPLFGLTALVELGLPLGLLLAVMWLVRVKEVAVVDDQLWAQPWGLVLMGRGGRGKRLTSGGYVVFRSLVGQIRILPGKRDLGAYWRPEEWPRFAEALQRAGVEVTDGRADWERRHSLVARNLRKLYLAGWLFLVAATSLMFEDVLWPELLVLPCMVILLFYALWASRPPKG